MTPTSPWLADLVHRIEAMPEPGHALDEVVAGVLRALAEGTDPAQLQPLRKPLEKLYQERAWKDESPYPPNPGYAATGLTHAFTRLLTALGKDETARLVATTRVRALSNEIAEVLSPPLTLSTDQISRFANRSADGDRGLALRHLAALLTGRHEEEFDDDLLRTSLVGATAWLDPQLLAEVLGQDDAQRVEQVRQKIWARAAAEVDRGPGSTVRDLGDRLAGAWLVVAYPRANGRLMADLGATAGSVVFHSACGAATGGVLGKRSFRSQMKPLFELDPCHPLSTENDGRGYVPAHRALFPQDTGTGRGR